MTKLSDELNSSTIWVFSSYIVIATLIIMLNFSNYNNLRLNKATTIGLLTT